MFEKEELDRLVNLHTKTLHGFQAGIGVDHVVVGMVPGRLNGNGIIDTIRNMHKCTTVAIDDWIGSKYVRVEICDRNNIPELVNSFLWAMEYRVLDPAPKSPLWKYTDTSAKTKRPALQALYLGTFVNCPNALTSEGDGFHKYMIDEEGNVFGDPELNLVIGDKKTTEDFHREHIMELSMILWTKLQPTYRPGMKFAIEQSELLYLATVAGTIERKLSKISGETIFESDAWKTREGKNFAWVMREETDRSDKNITVKGFGSNPEIDYPM